MKEKIQALALQYEQTMIRHRRHLHAHPEISFREVQTQAYIQSVLDSLGVPHESPKGCHSVVARIKGDKPGKTAAFRADIDALALQEQNDFPYRSQNDGVMHACGHDGHTAILLALAELLSAHRELVAGEAVLIFQHGEELPPGGASTIVAQGYLKGVDAIFGLHVWNPLELGVVGYNTGAMMACTDRFAVTLEGSGGHASAPHKNNDALVAAAALVLQLQTIISRRTPPLSPAVFSVCQLHSGSAFNITPQSAALEGTVRTTDETARQAIKKQFAQICRGVAETYGLVCDAEYQEGYPILVNNAQLVTDTVEAISHSTTLSPVAVPSNMGGEDFACYNLEIPGAYFFVGARNRKPGLDAPHHNACFDFDEAALSNALQVFLAAYLGYTA